MADNIIALRIKELRTSLGMNQKDFANALDIRQSTLSSYENGAITPSTDMLFAIAQKYNISLDWLFGISQSKHNISSLADVVDFMLRMSDLNELRYELEINEHLFNDIETDTDKWYASMKFYGNDSNHTTNAAMCFFLSALRENRENFETYFTDIESFEYWKKSMLERYAEYPLSQKKYEKIDFNERIKRRDALMNAKYGNKEQDNSSQK